MNLERTSIAISVTQDNRVTFKLLDSIRPNHISFSQYLGLAANEYYGNHNKGVSKITDFTNSEMMSTPLYYSEIEIWKKFVTKMPKSDIKKFQVRQQQLNNLINKRVQGILNE